MQMSGEHLNNTSFIGHWSAQKDISVRCGISAFTLPENAKVEVTQVDPTHSKVLVTFGERLHDWYPENWLTKNFRKEFEIELYAAPRSAWR